ncbi:jg25314 [Pararge aegeria aegeria]|uniref:Jg25314 protein n=2 Tax=Pararge aegeria TaxID=116150 RepID=A0A8S4S8U4_9NEOP|nr:jg25314 [Pararge aegeria aegeria]
MESEAGEPSYGVLKLQSPAPSTGVAEAENTFSFSNPVYSPTATAPVPLVSPPPSVSEPSASPSAILRTPRPSYKVEDVVFESPERPTSWRNFKRGVLSRWAVARAIYPYMVSIGLVYFTTLSLYPGIASEVPSCRLGSWMPIVLMSAFNFFDFIGKIAAAWPYEWSRSQLLMASGVRLLLVPLMLLCAAPRHSPHIVGDVYPIMFSVVLGFTNGLFGSIPMIMAPSRVGREHREIAGNMMTLSYNGGLLSGSLVSYLLLSMLGEPADMCRIYPTPVLPTIPPVPTHNGNASLMLPAMH